MTILYNIDWYHLAYAIGLFVFGYFLSSRVSAFVEKLIIHRFSLHQGMLFRRLIFYGIFFLFIVSALQQLGFNLTVLLGAAGVFTVALSFASQTAASNLISGIFLLFEHPFKVGDSIEVKEITGSVDSIDLLSTKLRTSDNKLVRIPNEVLIKSEITNLSYFPIRRIDIIVGVDYVSDLASVQALLVRIAESNDKVLKDPPPSVAINKFADFAIEIKLMAWVNSIEFNLVNNQLQEIIKKTFDEEGISIPFPQLTIHRG